MPQNIAKFVWYDVMTSDSEAAQKFYRSVVGWDTRDSGLTDRSYTILSAGPTMIGGLMPIPEHARAMGLRPTWMGYIGVNNVDESVERVKAAGGALHRAAEDIPGVGRFAVVADPHGASFILFKGASDAVPTAAAPGTPGHIGWHELHAGNLEEAFAFYSGIFGWTKAEAIDLGPMGSYQTFATGGAPVGGMMTKTPAVPMPTWLYYFNVPAIDAAAGRVTREGGQVVHGPHQVPGESWIVQCIDPQGAMFALLAQSR